MSAPLLLLATALAPAARAAAPAGLDSAEATLAAGAGGGPLGLSLRAQHAWRRGPPVLHSGLGLGLYTGREDHRLGPTRTVGRVSDLHLQLSTGPVWRPGARDRFIVETALYAGIYGVRSAGVWTHSGLGIREEVVGQAVLPDAGLLLSTGWQVAPGWAVQLRLGDSLRRIGGAQGLLGGLLTMDADAKLTAGLGLAWRPPAKRP